MDLPIAERHQIENEMIFRRANEKVGKGLDDLDAMYIEDGNPQLIRDKDMLILFRCECSDENCKARINVKLSVYQKMHLDRNAFVVKPKHQIDDIEKIIQKRKNYNVVEKNNSTPEPGENFNKT